jgi:CRISPR-associated protein Csm4
MNSYIVPLYFKNAMHIGSANAAMGIEETQDYIHSDTLWAAICNHWAIIGEVGGISFQTFIDSFKNGMPLFRISSAFPLTKDGKEFWLPKPLSVPYSFSQINSDRNDELEKYNKTVKRTRFIKLESFKRWIEFRENNVSEFDEQRKGISSNSICQHNTLDRLTMVSKLFHSGITYFDTYSKDKAGLYFILTADETAKNALEKIFEVICDVSAIGGQRNIGLGALAEKPVCIQALELGQEWSILNSVSNANAYCLLSLYYPNENEAYKSSVAYNCVLRKGWTGSLSVGTQVKRKTVSMFTEGSVFKNEHNENNKIIGQLVDITAESTKQWDGLHNIYRYGYAFFVPLKLNLEE